VAATSLEALERLASSASSRAPSKRMLVIVNPYATTVSARLKHLVVYALRGRYEVDSVETQARGHAIELCREAAQEGYDVVCAFGGDGTFNEVANGLAGSQTPMTCLPGGSTNVFCRILGIPNDVVDATEHLLALADAWSPRRIDLGVVNERRFLFTAGVGLDASVTKRVDAHPGLKARFGPWFYATAAVGAFNGEYLVRPRRLAVELPGGETYEGVTAIVQNTTPYTYFASRPIELAEDVALDSGTIAGVVLRRAGPLDVPTVAWRALTRARIAKHRRVESFAGLTELTIRSLDERGLPLQVDGDYLGERPEIAARVEQAALRVMA